MGVFLYMTVDFKIRIRAENLEQAWDDLDWKCCQAVHGANDVKDFFIATVVTEDEKKEEHEI